MVHSCCCPWVWVQEGAAVWSGRCQGWVYMAWPPRCHNSAGRTSVETLWSPHAPVCNITSRINIAILGNNWIVVAVTTIPVHIVALCIYGPLNKIFSREINQNGKNKSEKQWGEKLFLWTPKYTNTQKKYTIIKLK